MQIGKDLADLSNNAPNNDWVDPSRDATKEASTNYTGSDETKHCGESGSRSEVAEIST